MFRYPHHNNSNLHTEISKGLPEKIRFFFHTLSSSSWTFCTNFPMTTSALLPNTLSTMLWTCSHNGITSWNTSAEWNWPCPQSENKQPLKGMCHGCLAHFVNIANIIFPYLLWNVDEEITDKWKKITASCQTNLPLWYYIKSYKQQKWTLKILQHIKNTREGFHPCPLVPWWGYKSACTSEG